MKCRICNEEFSQEDIRELRKMREEFYRQGQFFICPDCWDDLRRKDLEEQIKILMKGGRP